MSDPSRLLTYASPKVHRRRWPVVLAVLIGIGVAAWQWPRFKTRYHAWQAERQATSAKARYERAFDAAWELPGGPTWIRTGNDRESGIAASVLISQGYATVPQVAFMRRGQTNGQKWLVVVSNYGTFFNSEVFYRENWPNNRGITAPTFPAVRPFRTYAQAMPMSAFIDVKRGDTDGNQVVVTVLSTQGALNRIQWSVTDLLTPRYEVRPLTGSVDESGIWTPSPPPTPATQPAQP